MVKAPILLIDDKRANLEALEALLGSQQYEIVTATSGIEGLAEVERRDFAVILLDVQMPNMDGIETAWKMSARAAELGRHAPIVFVSAIDSDRARILRAYASGAVDFLQKPIEPAVLEAKVAVFADLYRVREELRRALDESKRYRLLVESVKNYAIFSLDADGCIITWNAGAERLKGYAAAEIIGKHFSIFYPPEEVAAGKCERELEVAKEEGRFEEEGWRIRKDGSPFWASVTITALRSQAGALLGFAKVTRDLTPQKAAEADRLSAALVENMSELAWTARADGYIDLYNRRWFEYTGRSLEEMQGWGWEKVLDPRMLGQVEARWKESVATGEPFEMEFPLRRADGIYRWFLTRIRPLRDASGRVVRWFGTSTDIHELRRSREFQERFIAILGHDLRNPLSAIDMGVGILRQRAEKAQDGTAVRALDRMRSSSRRMARMIDQILDLTRSRIGGGLEMRFAEVDLCSLLTGVVDELRAAHPSRAIHLHCPKSAIGRWDKDRLEQVFSNLVGNAIHYGPVDTPVTVEASEDGAPDGPVRVSVHNDGPPIPEELQARIFNPFRRGDRDSRKARTEGLGLGLYISHEIVEAHRGEIELESSDALGTTFRVTLPRRPSTLPSR